MQYLINLFPSVDMFILFAFIIVLLLHLVFVKKTKLLVDIIAVYTSFILVILAPMLYPPFHSWLLTHPHLRVSSFVGLIVLLHVLLSFSNIANISSRIKPFTFATSFIYRLAIVGLMFTGVLYFLPADVRSELGQISHALFSNFWAMVIWFVLPFVLVFVYRFKTNDGWLE